ncbi:hypothetical protein OAM01_02165 [bacterium]|nr:hypothetical protein [bacterium]
MVTQTLGLSSIIPQSPYITMEETLGVILLGALFWIMFALARKAGYGTEKSLLLGIGILVPVVNLGILIWFVSTTWLLEARLASLKGKIGVGDEVMLECYHQRL